MSFLLGSSGCPLGPVIVGGPVGCLESQIIGGKMADVFITLIFCQLLTTLSPFSFSLCNLLSSFPYRQQLTYSETRVTLFPPVKLYSHLFLAPSVAFVFEIRAPFQSVPFMTRFVTGLQETTNWGFILWWSPSWYQARVKRILDILIAVCCHQLGSNIRTCETKEREQERWRIRDGKFRNGPPQQALTDRCTVERQRGDAWPR